MGWRAAVRSIGAAMRAAERESLRQQKAQMKEAIASDAAAAVQALESFQTSLISIHTKLADPIDWSAMASKPRPSEPALSSDHTASARLALDRFKPGLFDVFRGGSARVRRRLEDALASAPSKDRAVFDGAAPEHAAALGEWESDTDQARRLIAGDPEATKTVIAEMQAALEGEGYIGSHIAYHIEPAYLHATPHVHGSDVIPDYRRKQLASGRLSQTKKPVGEFNELYQDYVASVALKVAGDLFRVLPRDEIYVTCETAMVNPRTGHKEATPILSAQFVRKTFEQLNLERIDPSDAIANFRHAMSFKRAHGFAPIEPLRSIAA